MAKIIISRFEVYPTDEPTGYCVGFNIVCNNGRNFYLDTLVDLEESKGLSDEEIVALAYQKMGEQINSQILALENKSPLLGKELTIGE